MCLIDNRKAYVVHMLTLGLSEKPFPSLKPIRKVWHPFFGESDCFTRNRKLIRRSNLRNFDTDFESKPDPVSAKPFIKDIGSIWFNPSGLNTVNCGNSCNYDYLTLLYGNDGNEVSNSKMDDGNNTLFGYDPDIKDQRMYFLYWNLCNPVFIKADTGSRIKAEGNIFIHVYPSGYITIIFAISLDWSKYNGEKKLREIIKESKPWRQDNEWNWSSRIKITKIIEDEKITIKNGKLSEIFSICKSKLKQSFFVNSIPTYSSFDNQEWYSSIKIVADVSQEELFEEFSLRSPSIFNINLEIPATTIRYIINSKQISIIVFRGDSKRKTAFNLFWKILNLVEFVVYKKRIYKDLNRTIISEIENLSEWHYNYLTKQTSFKELVRELRRISIYDQKLLQFDKALDTYITKAMPFQKKIYSLFSKEMLFDIDRKKLHDIQIKLGLTHCQKT